MEKNGGGVGENTHRLEKIAKMLEKINTIKLTRTGRQWKSGSQRCNMEFQDVVAIWRKLRTGTFVSSAREPIYISQWTVRYWIEDGRSRAPCASMNFTLVISTRSHDSSPALSTQMVPEKVHAVPFTRKF